MNAFVRRTRCGWVLMRNARLMWIAAPAFGCFLALAGPAGANITITPTFDSTINNDPNATQIKSAINQAISFYQSNITTPIFVSITYAEMSSGLGQSSTYINSTSYSSYRSALASHATTTSDASAIASLPVQTNNPVNGTTSITASLPALRALGYSFNPPTGDTDSTISINTSLTNNTRTSINPSKYDLIAVVEHEMDEVLGIGSQLDQGSTSTTGNVSPEDLFRYSANGVRSYTTSSSATAYLSVNGGATSIVGLNQAGPVGGSDYGDWVSSGTHRVQDAFGTPGAIIDFGPAEQTALDVIGYTFVPEPSSLALAGIAAIGLLGTRRRHAARRRARA